MKIIYLIMSLLIVGLVCAIEQPDAEPILLSTIEQPVPPSGTDTSGECSPPEIKNEKCIGDVKHYDTCVAAPAGGGRWIHYNINCKDYGTIVYCVGGECVRESSLFPTTGTLDWKIIGIIALIIFAIILWRRK